MNTKINRIVLLNMDSYTSGSGMEYLIKNLGNRVVLVCNSKRFGKKYGNILKQSYNSWKRSGLNFLLYQSFNLVFYRIAIVYYKVLYALFGINQKIRSTRDISSSLNIPYVDINNVRDPNFVKLIIDAEPDLIISFYFDHIIRKNILDIPKFGTINMHTSKLPRCKGPFPILCSILKDVSGAISIHKISSEELDNGPILIQEPYSIDHTKSVLYNDRESLRFGATKMLGLIEKIDSNPDIINIVTENIGGDYMSFPDRNDIKSLKEKGIKLFNLSDY